MLIRRLALAVVFLLGLFEVGCSVAAVGATMTTVGGLGVLAYSCDGYVTVTRRDPQGNERCNEPVVLESEGRTRELSTCSWGRLPEGRWTVRQVGDRVTSPHEEPEVVVIEREEGCAHAVYSIELA